MFRFSENTDGKEKGLIKVSTGKYSRFSVNQSLLKLLLFSRVVKQLKGSDRSVSVINSIEVHHQPQNKHIFPSQVFFNLLLEVIRLIEVGLSVGEREPAFPVREHFS